MKKLLLLLIPLCLISVVFTGCKKKNNKAEVYPYLRIGFQANTSSKEYLAAVKFAEEVDRLSQGTVSVKIFPDGTLGDDISMLKQVAKGTLDVTYAETGRFGLWVDEAKFSVILSFLTILIIY